jgi:hypothetical protein
MGVQLIFYLFTIMLTLLLMDMVAGPAPQKRSPGRARTLVLIMFGLAQVTATSSARADFKVRSPIVTYREFEFEHNGSVTLDRKDELNRDQSYTYSLGLGVLYFWKIELEGETESPPGSTLTYEATTVENYFQLTPQGKYWADFGFFFEYSHGAQNGSTNDVVFGPMVQKETTGLGKYDLLHTLNVFFEREVGSHSTNRTGFLTAWQSRVLLDPLFEPGFEIYGGIEDLRRAGKLNDQQYNVGPMFAGSYSLAPYGTLRYELGYLCGLTSSFPRGVIRWRFEYEISF